PFYRRPLPAAAGILLVAGMLSIGAAYASSSHDNQPAFDLSTLPTVAETSSLTMSMSAPTATDGNGQAAGVSSGNTTSNSTRRVDSTTPAATATISGEGMVPPTMTPTETETPVAEPTPETPIPTPE